MSPPLLANNISPVDYIVNRPPKSTNGGSSIGAIFFTDFDGFVIWEMVVV
jgi:hypothetical protein